MKPVREPVFKPLLLCGPVQMEALKPALQLTLDQWSSFHRDLEEATLHGGELRCALQQQRAPLFSLKQAEEHMDVLQVRSSEPHVFNNNTSYQNLHVLFSPQT